MSENKSKYIIFKFTIAILMGHKFSALSEGTSSKLFVSSATLFSVF